MIRAFIRFWWKSNLENWRALRRVAMRRLPAKEQKKADAPGPF
jgi:hypothetical protein